MGFKERISLIVDVDSKAGTAGLKSLGKSIREADGFGNKFKAGLSGIGDSLRANVAGAAMAAGAALVMFAVKAVSAFQDTATAAREFGDATGMSTEQASRWIAIGDDMGIAADALELSVAKVAKTLDDTKWAKYGVATRDAAGEARTSNDVLLDSLDMLGKVENETERARIGNDLFGKGYANLAPMVGKTRAEYEQWLGSVEDGQVITAKEEEKAERLRKAQDALGDALGELTLGFGEMVAAGSPVIETLADIVSVATKAIAVLTASDAKSMSEPLTAFAKAAKGFSGSDEDIVKVLNALDDLKMTALDSQSSLTKAGKGIKLLADDFVTGGNESAVAAEKFRGIKMALDELWTTDPAAVTVALEALMALNDAAESGNEAAKEQMKQRGLSAAAIAELTSRYAQAATGTDDLTESTTDLTGAVKRNVPSIREAKEAYEGVATAAKEADRAFSELKGEIDDEQAWLDMLDTLDDYKTKQDDATASDREKRQSALDMKETLIGLLESIENLPLEKQTEILTLIDQGAFDEAAMQIGILTEARRVKINFDVGNMPSLVGSKYASGTSSAAPGVALVGEEGPELVMMRGGETVIPAGQTANALGGGSATYNVTVNGANMSADQLVAAIKAWERRNGPGWRQ